MDWASHVKSFQAQWIIRYAADPAASSVIMEITLLDSFLLEDDEGNANSQKDGLFSFANYTTDTKPHF